MTSSADVLAPAVPGARRTTPAPAEATRPGWPHVLAAGLRRLLWRCGFGLLGGLAVEGKLPAGGFVVVANHCSHADTPALLAALDARCAPRVAAAADYWFAGGLRPRVCRALVGGFAVRRGGGGAADLAAAVALLRAGRAVVVFPEGTRSRDGELAAFRSGALRLAAAAGVPVVPAGIAGTARLLPAGGAPARPRTPVAVRFGPPLDGPTAEQARAGVAALLGPTRPPTSRLRARAAAFATSPYGPVLTCLWAAAEALSWPLVPELAVGVLVLAAPRSWLRLAAAAVLGSVAGGALAYTLAAGGVRLPAPLTTYRMHAAVAEQTADRGPAAVRAQPLSGVPYKVYARQAGRARVGLPAFVAESTLARGARIVAVAALLAAVSAVLRTVLARRYAVVLAAVLPAFGVSFSQVVASWS